MTYAVVKNKLGKKEFTAFHGFIDEAMEEAKRLASKEACSFMVLKVVGYMEPSQAPVVWREENGNH